MFSQASLNSGKMVLMDHGTLIDHNYGQWFIRWYAGVLNTHTGCAETTAGFNNFIFMMVTVILSVNSKSIN